jgi:hypothetical protein
MAKARAIAIAAGLWAAGCGSGVEAARDAGGSEGADSGASADAATGDAGGTPLGGEAYRGEVLVHERFEDGEFSARGWYDASGAASLSAEEHAPVEGSARSFRCHFAEGANVCAGSPGRYEFAPSESVYLSYWVKYAEGWVGSGVPYHPHEFHFVTTEDDRFVGPARTHLTTYIEQVGLVPMLALQDSRNVDTACILRNNDTFEGCGGSFEDYEFSEARSVAACNGLLGDVDGRDCFPTGADTWYSARAWRGTEPAFEPGRWHFVEAYFRLNSIEGGVGQVDGAIRMWIDGEQVVGSDRVLMRTGEHPEMRFNQFLVAPYIGDGSPVEQTVYYDELVIARGRDG